MDKKIVMYSTPTCHFCHMTKEFFDEHNIEYTDYNVAEDTEKRQEMIEKSGQMGVPVIMIDDQMMIGFNKEKLAEFLGISA